MQAALSIFKMAANKSHFSSYVLAYMVDLLVAILKIKMAAYIIWATLCISIPSELFEPFNVGIDIIIKFLVVI